MLIERYIGGGTLFFSKYNGTTYDAEVEIGEIQSANLKITGTYVDAISRDMGVAKKVDKVASSIEAVFSFTTQNVDKANMAMAMLGQLSTEIFLIGATLPDGTVATVDTTLPVILGGNIPKIEGKFRFVGVNVSGSENPVLQIDHAFVTPTGDVRDYLADKHSTLGFDGEISEINGAYFKEYRIPKV